MNLEFRHFTMIFPRSYHDFVDFYRDFRAAMMLHFIYLVRTLFPFVFTAVIR